VSRMPLHGAARRSLRTLRVLLFTCFDLSSRRVHLLACTNAISPVQEGLSTPPPPNAHTAPPTRVVSVQHTHTRRHLFTHPLTHTHTHPALTMNDAGAVPSAHLLLPLAHGHHPPLVSTASHTHVDAELFLGFRSKQTKTSAPFPRAVPPQAFDALPPADGWNVATANIHCGEHFS
jgi:hypothetical protein